ncbi:DUF4268 domain-containing protein [Faecalibacter rhinopitheci]|uniref:DUF4268 domain-containing protein n=1 Tax=Faecalibacter rhinopitheci TaxID=2779678 RepID=A0A8J7KB57_9FLAO|nr:DUF4268 domain-containing protein [Faecalibacter rhinopitheci]MBF0598255.1 DUF4268 domain-containing protein [Faecalibacter rhinopitheci]
MYSKEESYQKKKDFWISYGGYMKLQKNAEGESINWINYKTGVKGIYFRTNVERKHADVMIMIDHPDADIRQLIWEQFEEYEIVLKSYVGEDWIWEANAYDDEGKEISTIKKTLDHVSIFRDEDWPTIISFLKERMKNLDEFWIDHKESFEIFK